MCIFRDSRKFLFNSSSTISVEPRRTSMNRIVKMQISTSWANLQLEYFFRCALIFLYLINQIFYPLHGINRFAQFNRLIDSPTRSTPSIYSTHRLTTTHRLTRLRSIQSTYRLTNSLYSLNLFDSPTHNDSPTHSTSSIYSTHRLTRLPQFIRLTTTHNDSQRLTTAHNDSQ